MYTVLFHRYDRLGCNLINYIAQIIFAHRHGYYIKIIDNKHNYPKYPDSQYYKILLNYIYGRIKFSIICGMFYENCF